MLLLKELIRWRTAHGEEFLTPNISEVFVHFSFLFHVLSLPVHPFLRGLLYFYFLELHNLNPNSMLHVVTFITLC